MAKRLTAAAAAAAAAAATPAAFIFETETYTLRLGINEFIDIEERLGTSMIDVAQKFANGNMRMLDFAVVFAAALKRSAPGITIDTAGTIIEHLGAEKAAELLGSAILQSPLVGGSRAAG
jgi:hypothetical protein